MKTSSSPSALEVYEFPPPLVVLVFCRMVVGHSGRIAQRISNLFDDFYDIIVGIIAAIVKFGRAYAFLPLAGR